MTDSQSTLLTSRILRRLAPYLFVAAVCAIPLGLAAIHATWADATPTPAGRDEPLHLRNALVIQRAIDDGTASTGSIVFGDLPERIRQTVYPPVAYLVSAWTKPVFARWTKTDYAASVCSLSLFAMILAASIYFAVRRLTGGGVIGNFFGLFAATTAVLLPLVFTEAHQYGPNLPATAMVALCAALFLRTDDLTRPAWTALFAVACGLAMLTYYTVFVFLAGPVLVALIAPTAAHEKPVRLRYALTLVAVVGVGVAIAAPFYFRADVDVKLIDFAHRFFGGIRPVAEESDLPAGSGFFAALFYYPVSFFTKQAGGLTGGVLVVGVVLALIHKTRARWHLLAGAVLPVVFFTLFNSKWAERTMPMLPLIVIVGFCGFSSIRGRRAAGLAVAFLCAMTTLGTQPGGTIGQFLGRTDIAPVDWKVAGPWSKSLPRMLRPFEELAADRADSVPLVGVPHNQMLIEYLADLARVRVAVVQAKTDPHFFTRFDEMAMAIVIRDRPDAPEWYTPEYLTGVATMRADLGPADVAERLARHIADARGEFAPAGSFFVRGTQYLCYLRRPAEHAPAVEDENVPADGAKAP